MIHGDSHHFTTDHPLKARATKQTIGNVTRLEVEEPRFEDSAVDLTSLPDDSQIPGCRRCRSRQRGDRARQAGDAWSGCRRATGGRTGQDRRIVVVNLEIVGGVPVIGRFPTWGRKSRTLLRSRAPRWSYCKALLSVRILPSAETA